MRGYICLIVCLVSVYQTSARQEIDIEYLTSLKHNTDLLKDLACTNLEEETQLINCVTYLLNKNESLADEKLAQDWLDAVNAIQVDASYQSAIAAWNYATNITDYTSQMQSEVSRLLHPWSEETKSQARKFKYKGFTDDGIKRQFRFMLEGSNMDDEEKRDRFDEITTAMTSAYGKGKVCRPKGEKYGTCSKDQEREGEFLSLEPDLEQILAHSRDYDELLWVWKGWRDAVGPEVGEHYPEYVELKNEAARNGGFSDGGEILRLVYEIPDDGLEAMVDKLYEEVKPMYKLLHTFIRRRLSEEYPGRVQRTGPIPAHVFGNMWSQQWNNIYDIAKPFQDVEEVDVSEEMVAQKYDVEHMFKIAEKFFESIGMESMPQTFWDNSMLTKPADGRDVVCHGSAYNFQKDREVRIKMCTEVNMEDLYTIHHEMGHCEYYLQYSDQPILFRSGANPGFHEAVGDTIALSVVTPSYLHMLKLTENPTNTYEQTINYQMKVALSKIAFLPFGLMIDKYRWEVFRGNIKPEEYNTKWWEYRLKYQGIKPPVERTEDDFDPGAKYHVASGTPYIRYFVSFLIQFQFQRALCKEAGFEGPLHECNIYQSEEAGAKLKEMLSLGISRPWTEALEVLTGQTEIDTSAIHEYFAPLLEYLEANTNDETIGWDEEDEVEQPTEEDEEEDEVYTDEEERWLELEFLAKMEEFKRMYG